MERSLGSLRQLEHHSGGSVRLYPNRQSDDYPSHWHTSFEIIQPVENEYVVLVGEERHRLRPGDILLIPSGMVHEIFAPETGLRYIFMVEREEICRLKGMSAVLGSFCPSLLLTPEKDGPLHREASRLMKRAAEEYAKEDCFAGEMMRLIMEEMLLLIGRSLVAQKAEGNPADEPGQDRMARFLDVCGYIGEHCHEKITLEDAARYAGYSKNHFARVFKELSGKSFYEYCLEQRMLLCEQLLGDPALPVTEAALRAGFGSIATFNRIFRERKGMSPTQYRKMLCEKR